VSNSRLLTIRCVLLDGVTRCGSPEADDARAGKTPSAADEGKTDEEDGERGKDCEQAGGESERQPEEGERERDREEEIVEGGEDDGREEAVDCAEGRKEWAACRRRTGYHVQRRPARQPTSRAATRR
jgi:hypothetical protein